MDGGNQDLARSTGTVVVREDNYYSYATGATGSAVPPRQLGVVAGPHVIDTEVTLGDAST